MCRRWCCAPKFKSRIVNRLKMNAASVGGQKQRVPRRVMKPTPVRLPKPCCHSFDIGQDQATSLRRASPYVIKGHRRAVFIPESAVVIHSEADTDVAPAYPDDRRGKGVVVAGQLALCFHRAAFGFFLGSEPSAANCIGEAVGVGGKRVFAIAVDWITDKERGRRDAPGCRSEASDSSCPRGARC